MRLYENLKGQEGLTLLELVITSAIVLLVLVGFMKANTSISKASESAFERTLALQDANQVLERMRNIAAAGTQSVVAAFPQSSLVLGFATLANQTVTVNYVDPNADPLDVTIQVNWLEHGLRGVNAHLRSYITQRLPGVEIEDQPQDIDDPPQDTEDPDGNNDDDPGTNGGDPDVGGQDSQNGDCVGDPFNPNNPCPPNHDLQGVP